MPGTREAPTIFGDTHAEQTLYDLIHRPEARRIPRMIHPAKPGAGLEISQTVPGGAYWEVVSLFARLGTSAAVANRTPNLTISDGTDVYARASANLSHPASIQAFYSWPSGYGAISPVFGAGSVITGFPVPFLPPGSIIATVTSSIQAADQWDTIALSVIEWRPARERIVDYDGPHPLEGVT